MKCFAITASTSVFCIGVAIASSLQAQTFDERMSDWPLDLKINGVVIANGVDEVNSSIIEQFLADAGGEEEAKIVTINFSSLSHFLVKEQWFKQK